MNRSLRYLLLALLWAAVAAYIIFAATTVRRLHVQKKVVSVDITVVDSTARGNLVSASMVRSWISASGIQTVGAPVDEVRLGALERMIADNGFVDRVRAYVNYGGELYIDISQRKPIVRLMTGGINSYASEDGYVFAAPRASSLYVPVVTGTYKLPFDPGYAGSVRDYINAGKTKIDQRIAELEELKFPVYKRELQNDRDIRALRRKRISRDWLRFESAADFEKRVAELREDKVKKRREYRYRARMIQEELDGISRMQEEQRRLQKKLEKSYEDFAKLLTFVEDVESDDFWRSEIVQIVARTAPSGALEIELIPRSGSHTVIFGRLEEVENKLDKLFNFYDRGLMNIGWSEYKTIDIRYKDRVVCKK